MEYSNFEGKIKNIIYASYTNVFDFDVKSASNGGNELKIVITFRTSLNQLAPIRVKIILERDSGKYTTKRIYVNKIEKLTGLRDSGSVGEFVDKFRNGKWEDSDVDEFIKDNEDIIKDEGSDLEKSEIISLLEISKERLV